MIVGKRPIRFLLGDVILNTYDDIIFPDVTPEELKEALEMLKEKREEVSDERSCDRGRE